MTPKPTEHVVMKTAPQEDGELMLRAGSTGGKTHALAIQSGPAAVLALMAQAVEKGMAVDTMESLQRMFHAEQDRAAAREFADAMAQFQATCPAIPKSSTAKVTSKRTGATFQYTYAELDQIAETVKPHLHGLGMSFSWDSAFTDRMVTATCTLRHRNGHAAVSHFSCPTDSDSAMSGQQQHAAALTFAKRQSLIAVLGLTTTEPDAEGPGVGELIGQSQEALLDALIEEVGADKAKMLKWLGVASLASIPVSDYVRAVNALEQKRKKA
jgi:hypothetical protein